MTIIGAGTVGNPFVAITGGTGDVVGPASATDSNFASFDTTTGKLIKDSGSKASDFATALGADDNYVTDVEKAALHGVNDANTSALALDQTTPQTIINGQPVQDNLTASELVATDASKKLSSLAVATYPSLTEVSYVKGLTSAAQTQLTSIKDISDYADSPMIITGGDITDGTTGTFTVAALTALLRATDRLTGTMVYITLAEQANQSITAADTTYYVCLDYNGGTPQIVLSTTNPYSRASSPDRTQIVIGKVMKDGSDVVHFIAGGYDFQDGVRKLHERIGNLRNLEMGTGSAIAYSGTNNFTMTAGIVFGGVNKFTMAAYDSAATTFTPIYSDGGAGFTEGAASNVIDYAHYDLSLIHI